MKLSNKKICKKHNPKYRNNYLGWNQFAREQTKKGKEQRQCKKCKRWLFPSEF